MKKPLLISLLLVSSLTQAATIQSMSKEKILRLLPDKTITTVNLLTLDKKLINNTLTAYFDENGHLTGQLTNNVSSDDPQVDKGTWTVHDNGTLCATWQHWNSHKPVCVFLYELTNAILFTNKDTNTFESMILKTNIKIGNQLQTYVI